MPCRYEKWKWHGWKWVWRCWWYNKKDTEEERMENSIWWFWILPLWGATFNLSFVLKCFAYHIMLYKQNCRTTVLTKQTKKSCIDLAVHRKVNDYLHRILRDFKADGMCQWFEARKKFESQSVNECDGVARKFWGREEVRVTGNSVLEASTSNSTPWLMSDFFLSLSLFIFFHLSLGPHPCFSTITLSPWTIHKPIRTQRCSDVSCLWDRNLKYPLTNIPFLAECERDRDVSVCFPAGFLSYSSWQESWCWLSHTIRWP